MVTYFPCLPYVKQGIVYYRRLGESYEAIVRHLEDEGHKVTKAGAHKFWKCFEEIETIQRKPGSGRKAKFCLKAEEMAADEETTREELKRVLQKNGIHVCARTAVEWRKKPFLNARNFDEIP